MAGIPIIGGRRTAVGRVDKDVMTEWQSQDGFTDVFTRNGVGEFTVILSKGVAPSKQIILMTLEIGAFQTIATYQSISDTQIDIQIECEGVLADSGFSILVLETL